MQEQVQHISQQIDDGRETLQVPDTNKHRKHKKTESEILRGDLGIIIKKYIPEGEEEKHETAWKCQIGHCGKTGNKPEKYHMVAQRSKYKNLSKSGALAPMQRRIQKSKCVADKSANRRNIDDVEHANRRNITTKPFNTRTKHNVEKWEMIQDHNVEGGEQGRREKATRRNT